MLDLNKTLCTFSHCVLAFRHFQFICFSFKNKSKFTGVYQFFKRATEFSTIIFIRVDQNYNGEQRVAFINGFVAFIFVQKLL